jgi:predicted dinucleotide-binding enzyme
MMKITILGSGNIGSTLGKKWAKAGHAVTFAARNPDDPKYQDLLKTIGGNGAIAALPEAVNSAEVILLAIPGTAVEETMAGLGQALDGKVIIDATNKIQQAEMNSLAAISAKAPAAKLFRAFNSLGWENFETPQLGETQIDLFYCGDPGEAKETAEQLIADIGLRPIYVGNLDQVAVIDTLTRLWFALAIGQGHGRRLAFKMLTE